MEKKDFNQLKEKELWTQKEVADYFRVVPSTIKKWRDQGLLSYWQAPGSTRVLYFGREVMEFLDKNSMKTGGKKNTVSKKMKKVPAISEGTDENWRI